MSKEAEVLLPVPSGCRNADDMGLPGGLTVEELDREQWAIDSIAMLESLAMTILDLSQANREKLLTEVLPSFMCMHCGVELHGQRCHCTNDE